MSSSPPAAPAPTPRPPTSDSVTVACAVCGLTEMQFRHTGLLGCYACYAAFAPLIARAVAELHGVTLPPLPKQDAPPPVPVPDAPPPAPAVDVHAALPWPTRRARQTVRPSSAPKK